MFFPKPNQANRWPLLGGVPAIGASTEAPRLGDKTGMAAKEHSRAGAQPTQPRMTQMTRIKPDRSTLFTLHPRPSALSAVKFLAILRDSDRPQHRQRREDGFVVATSALQSAQISHSREDFRCRKRTQGTQNLRPEIFAIFAFFCGSIIRTRLCGAAFYRGFACRQFGEAANAYLPNLEGPPLVVL